MKLPAHLSAALAGLLLSGCEIVPPPPPDYVPPAGVPGRDAPPPLSAQAARDAYRTGETQGAADRRYGRSFNPQRNSYEVPEGFRDYYRQGYRDGFSGERDSGSVEAGERNYRSGYRLGFDDAAARRSSNWRRHGSSYSRRYEESFRRGYLNGYDEGIRRPAGYR